MTFFAEERAVSPVLGGILMFGLAMSLLILTQVSVVPAANQQVEFEHNLGVQQDFERLQGSATRVAASGAAESVDVDLGTRYPNRFFLVNPAPASGSLTTEDTTLTISNVDATNPETAEYFANLPTPYALAYDTKRLVYEPTYRQYGNAPRTIYEHGTVYNRYDGDVTLAKSTVPLVSGNEITFVVIDGDVNLQTVDTETLAVQAASAPAKRLAVTNEAGPITIAFETFLPQDHWQDYADGEAAVTLASYTVSGTSDQPNEVVLQLDTARDYTLRVAKLTIGDNAVSTERAYVTSVGSYASAVPANTSITYTVEVRDVQHNAFTSGEVTATVAGDAHFSNGMKTINATVDENGRATVTVTGDPNALGVVTVDVGRDTDRDGDLGDELAHRYVTYDVELVTTAVTKVVADVGNAINPGNQTSGDLGLVSVSTNEIQFENLGTESKSVQKIRVNFVKADGQGSASVYSVTDVTMTGAKVNASATDGSFDAQYATTFVVGGDYQSVSNGPLVVDGGEYLTLALEFDGADQDELSPGDFYVVSVRFADGTSSTYFAGVV